MILKCKDFSIETKKKKTLSLKSGDEREQVTSFSQNHQTKLYLFFIIPQQEKIVQTSITNYLRRLRVLLGSPSCSSSFFSGFRPRESNNKYLVRTSGVFPVPFT